MLYNQARRNWKKLKKSLTFRVELPTDQKPIVIQFKISTAHFVADKPISNSKMLKQLAFFLLAMFCLTTLGATSKCDPRIIKMIEDKFWNCGRCVPKDLLKTVSSKPYFAWSKLRKLCFKITTTQSTYTQSSSLTYADQI